ESENHTVLEALENDNDQVLGDLLKRVLVNAVENGSKDLKLLTPSMQQVKKLFGGVNARLTEQLTKYTMLQTLNSLLYKACQFQAKKCLALLLRQGATGTQQDDINERSLIHKLTINGGF